MEKPLAFLWRPESINDVIGQEHLINNKNGIIFRMLKYNFITSLIFYGSPGIGKTSLALALIKDLNVDYAIFNCALDKKSDLENIINNAKKYDKYIVILEEIHRMNRDRQDILLQSLESRSFVIFACTTENPYYTINPAIRSRATLIALDKINEQKMFEGLKKVIKIKQPALIERMEDKALKLICDLSSGDLRIAINILELIINLYPKEMININLVKMIAPASNLVNSHYGNHHYDLKSALQKSIRGSDVDAALYYLAQMLATGDYEALLRRLLIIAYEDIGLANPTIPMRLNVAIDSFRQVGMPEGKIILGQIVIEMALSTKSNSAYLAINKAYDDVINGKVYSVPKHLRSNSFQNTSQLKMEQKYKYPHDFDNGYINQQYLPKQLLGVKYYLPKFTSSYEQKINQIHQQFTKKK